MHPVEVHFLPIGWALRKRRPDETASIATAPELATENRIVLNSPSFHDGETIPARHCGQFIGDEIPPALSWRPLPAGTQDLLLVIEDLDRPGQAPGVHTIAAMPTWSAGLDEGALTPSNPGIRFFRDHHGRARYVGPRPLPGHGTHRYRFHLYAVAIRLDPSAASPEQELLASVDGHVLASGRITGTRTT